MEKTMDSQPEVKKSKTKNEEIADLVEQQVQGVVDPFAATFNALWGTPPTASQNIHVQKNTGINMDMSENIHAKKTIELQDETKSVAFQDVLSKNVQEETDTNSDIYKNIHLKEIDKSQIQTDPSVLQNTLSKFIHVQKKTSTNLYNETNIPEILTVVKETANFALVGFITFLNLLYPNGKGIYSINGLARISGMSRTSIRGNLQNLEKLRFITLAGNEISLSPSCQGWLNLYRESENRHGQIHTYANTDMSKNIHAQIQTDEEDVGAEPFSVNNGTNLDMSKFVHIVSSSCNNIKNTTTTNSTNSTMSKFIHIFPWEKAQMISQAEELFYVGLAARVDVEVFSMQTVTLYKRISKERGKEYAAALFWSLLPKARDNLTGYISSAFKQGAEPSAGTIAKVREMWELIDALLKAPVSEEIRQRIKEATDTDDTETITALAQQQTQVKAALRMLSWDGTTETLIEKRDAFVESLFGG
jgi:hypothetical protein